MLKFFRNLLIGTGLLVLLPVVATPQWSRTEVNGRSICERESGEQFTPSYASKNFVTVSCNILNEIETWLGGSLARAQFIFIPDTGVPDPGDPDAPPEGWAPFEVSDAAHPLNSTSLTYSSDTSTFTSGVNGGWIFGTDDSFGGWRYVVPTTGDFTATARVVTFSQEVASSKGGIKLQESLDSGAAGCMLAVFATNGTLIDCRATTDGTTSSSFFEGTSVTLPYCLRISVDRSLSSVKYFTKADASDCSTGTYTERLQQFPAWAGAEQNIYLLLATTPTDTFNTGKNATTTFDQVVVSTEAVDHAPGDVQFDPTSYSVNEDDGPVTLTATRTGPATGSCSLDYTTVNGTAVAGTHYTTASGTLTWDAAETGEKTFNVTVANIETAQGDKQFTATLTKNTCTGDDLNADTATVTIFDTDGSVGFFNEGTPTNTIQQGLSGYGVDWTDIITGSENYQYRFIDNLNTSGAGSFTAALNSNCPTNTICVIIPRISGAIAWPHNSSATVLIGRNRFVIAWHWAPSPGLHIQRKTYTWRNSTYILMQHYSCHNDNESSQSNSSCISWYGQSGDLNNNHVVSNGGGLFAYDTAFNVGRKTNNLTLVDNLVAWPEEDGGKMSGQGQLFGEPNAAGGNTNLALIRGVVMHARIRCPMTGPINGIFSGFVCYNMAQAHFQTHAQQHADSVGAADLMDALFVRGTDTGGNHPIRYTGGSPQGSLDLYVDGVRGFPDSGVFDDTPISNMITAQAGNVVTQHATSQATWPDGFQRTSIGAGDAGEHEYALNACRIAGPRSADRLPMYQKACDTLDARFTGVGDQGAITSDISTLGGMPTVAVNTCDPFTANSCNPGQPALPTAATANESDTFINKFFTANEAARCAVSVSGTPGC